MSDKSKFIAILFSMFIAFFALLGFAQAQTSIPTISPFMYWGGGTTNIRTATSTTRVLLGATATTTNAFLETPSLTITGLLNKDCLGTNASGQLEEGTCGGGSGGGLATTSIDTETELEDILTDVTDVFTNNDGALSDDDLTNDSIEDLNDVAAITETLGDLLYWNGSAWADIATSSLGINFTNLVGSATDAQVTDALTISSSGSVDDGALSANVSLLGQTIDISGETNLAATYPVLITGDTLSLAFGTTTSNTWAGTQTFTNTSATNATSTNMDITGLLTFNGVTGDGWTDFCTTITGSAGLCDGDDATGAGGSAWPFTPDTYNGVANQSTTTPLWLKNTQIIASSTNFTTASSTLFTNSGSTWLPILTSALILTDANGLLAEYAGSSCTNQFANAFSALGVATCASVVSEYLGDDDWGEITLTSGVATIDDDVIGAEHFADQDWGQVSITSGVATVEDMTCTDCIGTTEIADSYLLNTGDTGTGAYTFNDNDGTDDETMLTIGDSNDLDNLVVWGNVGIGTTTPQSILSIAGATPTFTITNTTNGSPAIGTVLADLQFKSDDQSNSLQYQTRGSIGLVSEFNTTGAHTGLAFSTHNGTTLGERMRIDYTGNVGIGTTTPSHALTIANATKPQLALTDASGGNSWTFRNKSGTLYIATSTYSATSTVAAIEIGSSFGEVLVQFLKAAVRFILPNSAAPTLGQAGSIALDTTSNNVIVASSTSGHFVIGGATTTLAAFTVASTSPDFASGGIIPIPKHFLKETAIAVICAVDGGTSQQIFFSDGTNDTNTITCTTTETQYALTTNNVWNAYEAKKLEFVTKSGSPDYLTVRLIGYRTSD